MGFLFKTLIVLAAVAVQFGLSSGRLALDAAAIAATALAAGYVVVSMIRFKGDPTARGRNIRAAMGASAVALVALYPAARSFFPSVDILKFLLAASMIALLASRYRKLRRMERLDGTGARNEFDSLLRKCLELLPEAAQARLTASDIMMWKHLLGRVRSFNSGALAVFPISHDRGQAARMRRITVSAALLILVTLGLSFLSGLAAIVAGLVLGYDLVLKIAQARSAKSARIAVYDNELIVIDGHFAYIRAPRTQISAICAKAGSDDRPPAPARTLEVGDDTNPLLICFEQPQPAILPFGLTKEYAAILLGLSASDGQSLERMLDVQTGNKGEATDAGACSQVKSAAKTCG